MINYRVTTEQRAFEAQQGELNRQAQLEASRISSGSAIRAAEIAAASQREAGNAFNQAIEKGNQTIIKQLSGSATSLLKKYGGKDKLLSFDEFNRALNDLAPSAGSTDLAFKALESAFKSGGFGKWRW